MDDPRMMNIIGIAIGILIFLLLREFVCWYFKINERRNLLEKILEELQTFNGHEPINNSEENESQKPENDKNDNENGDVEQEEDDVEDDDEPVEDPFWNKK